MKSLRRITAASVLAAYVAGCTHMPTGQKAFDSFEQCIAANLGLATVGGFAVGALGKSLVRQVTGDSRAQNAVGTAAGVATAVMIGLAAWKKCAAVYNKSEPLQPAPQPASTASAPPPAAPARQRPGVHFERLDVRVEGTDNDPPSPEFDFVFVADDPAAKDIKAVFRHKVEIVRFKADENDQLVLAAASGEAIRDAAGKPVPLAQAMRTPRERLAWVTIAEEGRDDYVEDVVIQQGRVSTFRHRLQVPPREQLPVPLPVPMRYTVTVEAAGHRASRTVDFALLPTAERPKQYSSGARPAAAPAPAAPPPVAPVAPVPNPAAAADQRKTEASKKTAEPSHSTRRAASLYDRAQPPRKTVGRLKKGQAVIIDQQAEVKTGTRTAQWAKVLTEDGREGWLPMSELHETK